MIGSVCCLLSSKEIFKSHNIAPLITSEHVRNFINNRPLTLSFQLFSVQLVIYFQYGHESHPQLCIHRARPEHVLC